MGLTWSQAQRECREKYTDLVSVRDQAENEAIRRIMDSSGNYWIGLYRDSWKWSDGSNSSFRHWGTGLPNGGLTEPCTVMKFDSGSKWDDRSCDFNSSFICYGDVVKKQVLRVKLTTNPSLDLNNPAVADAILEQLKQNMQGHHQGAPADIKVRWVEQVDGRLFHKEDEKKWEKKKKRERKPKLTKREL